MSFAFAAGCGDDSAAVMDLGPLPGDAGEIPDMTVDAFEPLLDRDGTLDLRFDLDGSIEGTFDTGFTMNPSVLVTPPQ